ncbi:MAG: ferrous iron transport protein B [Candidatus Omnitrophota bacterium]
MLNKIGLAGTPNSGKTTLFNCLTGAKERIGNWPGTTVERKEGRLSLREKEAVLVDLPGTYSLDAYSLDEKIAQDFIVQERPDLIVAVIDASNLKRNLFLVAQLLEMGENVVLALNMMDRVKEHGLEINMDGLSKILKIPVIPTIACEGKGVAELKEAVFANLDRPGEVLHMDYAELEPGIQALEQSLSQQGLDLGYSLRALAIRILENDPGAIKKLEDSKMDREVPEAIRHIELEHGENIETFVAERRFAYLKGLVKECARHHLTFEERLTISDQIDKVLTNRFLGIPIFLGFMFILFSLVFAIGEPLVNLLNNFFAWSGEKVVWGIAHAGGPAWLGSLVSDGIIAGVGSVLGFLPYIMLLFLGMSFLENTGYLARAAFIMDHIMHALGLHGKSFIPMLLGFGCTVPAIMAARTLESEKDRILTILILPLMSCSARLPVYTLFAAALFPRHEGLIVFSLYLLGIILAILIAQIFKRTLFKEEVAPLVMELPPYHMPRLRHVFLHMWLMSLQFIKKAGTIILVAAIVVWILAYLPAGVDYASEQSLIGHIGKFLAPVFRPAGFGFWQAAVALLLGISAKELVVGAFGTLYGVEQGGLAVVLSHYFTPLSAYAFLIMTLVYIPCIATIAVIKKETNWKWAGLAVFYTLALGWLLSVVFYQVGRLFS